MRNINIIVYACDFNKDLGTVGHETKERLSKAFTIINSKPAFYRIFFGAGTVPDTGFTGKESMSRDFEDILEDAGYFRNPFFKNIFTKGENQVEVIISETEAWGTFRETESIMDSLDEPFGKEKVIAISSSYHIPRIKFIWWFMPKTNIKFVSVPMPFPLKGKILEPLRYLKVLFLGMNKLFGV